MKLVKRWLFPALTCLLVVGAAVLPARVSQARDARLFGQVHAEVLEADALPVHEPPSLIDRIKLYTGRFSSEHPILSSSYLYETVNEELARSTQEMLTEAGVLPSWIFEEEPFEDTTLSRSLLWDPAESSIFQEPSVFWGLSWSNYGNKLHQKSIRVSADAETGLPIELYVSDTNMSQWLPYDTDDLRALAERFFELLGLEVRETGLDGPGYAPSSLNLSYSVAGSEMIFFVTRSPTILEIQPDFNWRNRTDASSAADRYDG